MYGECGQTSTGARFNCKYDGEAKLLSEKSGTLFKEMCPHLFNENQTYTCCDSNQIERLNNGFSIPRQLLSNCPACFLNFKTFLCDIICNPNQRDFLLVTKEEPYIPATTTNPIDAELRFEIFNQKLESNKT